MIRKPIQQLVCCSIRKVAVQPVCNASTTATQPSLVNLTVDDKSGFATLTLNKPPVNSLNLELISEISDSLDQLEANKSKGLIITSALQTVFSAGLDIRELYKPDFERATTFYSALQDMWVKLYGSSFPTAAAINGHAPAGGCLIAGSCEYRVMCPKFTIGLNETRVGIFVPDIAIATYCNVLSKRDAEKALTLGQLFTTDEALSVGLIDEVATDKQEAVVKCNAFLAQFSKVSPRARALTKQAFRANYLAKFRANRKKDLHSFVDYFKDPEVQNDLMLYLQSLKKKNK